MAVGAFKTKYTGEQMEQLFDVLSSGSSMAPQAGADEYYTLEQDANVTVSGSDWVTKHVYKTQDMTVTMTGSIYGPGRGAHVCSLFNTNTNYYIHTYGGATLEYVFKKPINPWRVRYSGGPTMTVEVYNGTKWTTLKNNVSSGIYDISCNDITKIKISLKASGQSSISYCILDFHSSNYIHNPTIKKITDPVSVAEVDEIMTLE